MSTPEAMRAAADAMAAHKVPVLVVSGGWTAFFEKIGEVVARFTGGRYAVVPAANHMVQQVSAQPFNALLETFMREAESR